MGEPVILVTGTPGTGKTALSNLLASFYECSTVNSSQALINAGAASPDPTGRYTMVVDWDAGVEAARRLIESIGGCVVVDTLYPSLWMEAVGDRVAVIVLLRCHPRELCNRLSARRWPWSKVAENCASEALGSIASEVVEWSDMVVEADTTGRSPQSTLDLVLDLIYSWRTGVHIDWLSIDESLVEDLSKWLPSVDLG